MIKKHTIGFYQRRHTQYDEEPFDFSIEKKIILTLSIVLAVASVLWVKYEFRLKTCHDFKDQAQAKRVFTQLPKRYSQLDRDGDGKACNSLRD